MELTQKLSDEQPDPASRAPRTAAAPAGRLLRVTSRAHWADLDMSRQVVDATRLSCYVETCGFGVIAVDHWPAARMAAQGFAIILRRHQIENLAAAALDDELEIATWVSNVQRASATRHYTIRRVTDGTLLSRVDTLGVWVDLTSGRPIRIPPDFLADLAAQPGSVIRQNQNQGGHVFVFRHQTADSFLAHVQAVLEQHEAANNLMIGIGVRLREPPDRIRCPPIWRRLRMMADCLPPR